MKSIEKIEVKFHHQSVGTISFTPDKRLCTFEYDDSWLTAGFSISPLELPLQKGIFIAKPTPFDGNFGIFEDSMPDGYGRYLLGKTLQKEGLSERELTTLQRLAIVGETGMGALTYHPQISVVKQKLSTDLDYMQQKALEVLSERQDDDAALLLFNSGNSGGARPKAIFSDDSGHWLVKFRHTYDPKDIGKTEFEYNRLARECGIDVPEFRLIDDKYFASGRFDISADGDRIHIATAGGLLGVSLGMPVLDYSNLLALTGFITQSDADVEEMYRRMIFNYLMENKDDHAKNFSFYVLPEEKGGWQWRLAPAYDLTLNTTGYNGQHATSVNGTGNPHLADFIEVGIKIGIPESTCCQIIDTMTATCRPRLCHPII